LVGTDELSATIHRIYLQQCCVQFRFENNQPISRQSNFIQQVRCFLHSDSEFIPPQQKEPVWIGALWNARFGITM
jgi:hypothetical protein